MPVTYGSAGGSGAKGEGSWRNPAGATNPGALASASRAVGTANGGSFDVSKAQMVKGRLHLTDPNGGNVTVSLEGSADGGTSWSTIGSFPNKSQKGVHAKEFSVRNFGLARWKWTVAGAAVTFAVDTAVFAPR